MRVKSGVMMRCIIASAGWLTWRAGDAGWHRVLQRAPASPTDPQRLHAQRSRRPSAPELDAQVEKMWPGARNSPPQLHRRMSSTTGAYSSNSTGTSFAVTSSRTFWGRRQLPRNKLATSYELPRKLATSPDHLDMSRWSESRLISLSCHGGKYALHKRPTS